MAKRGTEELNEQQSAFAEQYIVDFNGKRAAISAGYSEKTAESQASSLLRRPKVAQRISELIEARSERVAYDADALLVDSVQVLRVAKEVALERRTSTSLLAFKGIAELVGKHVDVQAFRQQVDVNVNDTAALMEAANRRLEAMRSIVSEQ